MVEVGFTNCVFGKRCFAENTIFIVLSAKHSNCRKHVCWTKAENQRKRVFLKMAKRCFCFGVLLHFWFVLVGCVVFVCSPDFGVLNGFVVCFGVFGKVANMLKMLVSHVLILGLFYSCLFEFGRFSARWDPKSPTLPNPSFSGVCVFFVCVFLLFCFFCCCFLCFCLCCCCCCCCCCCWSVFGVFFVLFYFSLVVVCLCLFLFVWYVCWSVLLLF